MNEKKPTWNCPVCDKEAYFNELVVDDYFIEICSRSKMDEVEFGDTGEWKEYVEKKDREPKKERKPKSTAVVIHDITLDDSPPTSPAINGTDGDTLPIGESSRVNNGVSIIPDDDDDHDEDDDDDDVICISDSDDEPAPKRTRLDRSDSANIARVSPLPSRVPSNQPFAKYPDVNTPTLPLQTDLTDNPRITPDFGLLSGHSIYNQSNSSAFEALALANLLNPRNNSFSNFTGLTNSNHLTQTQPPLTSQRNSQDIIQID